MSTMLLGLLCAVVAWATYEYIVYRVDRSNRKLFGYPRDEGAMPKRHLVLAAILFVGSCVCLGALLITGVPHFALH